MHVNVYVMLILYGVKDHADYMMKSDGIYITGLSFRPNALFRMLKIVYCFVDPNKFSAFSALIVFQTRIVV